MNYQQSFRRKSRLKLMLALVFTILVLIFGSVWSVRFVYNNGLKPVNGSLKRVIITVPTGASVKDVADLLKNNNLIKSQWAFKQYIRNNNLDDNVKAGTYALQPSQSVAEIVDIITEGKVKTDLITIIPGSTLQDIKRTFIKNGFKGVDIDNALKPEQYLNEPAISDKPTSASLEGYLYPESFQKNANTLPRDIILKSLRQMHKHLTPELRNGFVAHGLTVHQGIILASIIEQEVTKPSDKAQVAQVFLKRFKNGLPLESDATAIYGAVVAGLPPSLTYDSPYNTYLHNGFPAGPISNVSESSLKAATNPSDTDWLYFVSGDDGVTYFSKTLAEHESLTAQHCKKNCGTLR